MNRIGKLCRDNGLTIVLMLLFLGTWSGQFWTGLASHNEERVEHRLPEITARQYLTSGHFIESTFENWESEFLQMALFVWLTAKLYQRGSAESNPLPDEKTGKKKSPIRHFKNRPFLRKLYENSLGLALFTIFMISFLLHLYGGWKEQNLKIQMAPSPQPEMSIAAFLWSADFWFQSFQNWQSEFLSVASIVVLTIFLRQKDSAQSKEMDAPHLETKT